MPRSKANTESLQQQAYVAIVEMIVNRDLSSDQAIVERDLAEKLQMSRAPIREALLMLEQEGLVRRIGSRTRVISEPTLQDVIEIYEVREMLEGMAARLLAPRITDNLLKKLQKFAEKLDGPNGWKDSDEDEAKFHNLIVEHCGNTHLRNLIAPVHRRLVMMRVRELLIQRGQLKPDGVFSPTTSHQRIVEAIQSRDPDQAEASARAHIRENKTYLLQHMFEMSPGTSQG